MNTRAFRAIPTVDVMGMSIASIDSQQLLEHIVNSLTAGSGGWLVTANLDILLRHTEDPDAQRTYALATLRVADGMPLIWASRIQGQPLPERIAGSTFMYSVVEQCAALGWGVFLLGGATGSAEAAAAALRAKYPGLHVEGCSAVTFDSTPTAAQVDDAATLLSAHPWKIVLVGLGSPKQEHLIAKLRGRVPSAWLIGVGGSFSFVSGQVARAPRWAQDLGLEWAHRLAQEPRRLARRYLVQNLPFFTRLVASAVRRRIS
jgi:N-acetylglucosaminyldiphosphoundecaprenol N-acetyl-beta-D-mannosaminyltransferase